ncbi:MAG: septum formation initiator [Lachnospiraceae bacterium]|nr:septum formation initiator [Lachnospiraceae bacterium]
MAKYGKRKKKKQNRLAMFAITLVVAALLGVLGLQTVRLKQRRDEYATKLEAIEKQMSEQEARAEELEAERLYVQTKDYIEKVARERLGLVSPDEIILKPEGD